MKRVISAISAIMFTFSTPAMTCEDAYSSKQLMAETTRKIVFDDEASEYGYIGYKVVDENGNEVEMQYDDIAVFSRTPSYYRNTELTPVKNQNEEGCCWAFAMIGAMEASLIKQGYNADKLDFSEAHMAYFTVNIRDSIYKDGPQSIGVDAYSYGGNEYRAVAAMSKGSGAVSESVAPYEEYTKDTKTGTQAKEIDESKRFLCEAGLNALKIIDPKNPTAIKQAIMTYGSVLNAFYYNGPYYNKNQAAYHCPDSQKQNHQTLIVGWDDTYPKENFNDTYQPENDGAWIVRNSWGDEYGEEGYFYMSYETTQATITAVRAFIGNKYDNNYGYTGAYSLYCYTSYPTVYSNIFTVDSDEVLEAISFLAISPAETVVSVYKNPTTVPSSGKLMFRGTVQAMGMYNKIDFPDGIALNAGDSFSVVIDGPVVGIDPPEEDYTSNPGKCFVYADKWYQSYDLLIRAYTNEHQPKINTQIRNNTIEVESKYNDNATIYIAQYDNDELIDIKIATEATLNANATKYRIFSWDLNMSSTTKKIVEDEI